MKNILDQDRINFKIAGRPVVYLPPIRMFEIDGYQITGGEFFDMIVRTPHLCVLETKIAQYCIDHAVRQFEFR